MHMKKGQAAMEYLMTYGWAIIIVIIVAAALYALGLFNPQSYMQDTATGFSNIGKPATGSWQLLSSPAGSFTVLLGNQAGYGVNVTSVTVTSGATACTAVQLNSKSGIGAGIDIGIGLDFNITATCGAPASGAAYSIDIDMSGTNDKGLSFADSGRVTGTVA
jgi:hypothetical protein